MQFRENVRVDLCLRAIIRAMVRRLAVACIAINFFAQICDAHFFSQPGYFLYAENAVHKVFDITGDGTMAVALKNDSANVHSAVLTSFDPTSGVVFDSKTFGFGPLEVGLAETPNGRRVVVLT